MLFTSSVKHYRPKHNLNQAVRKSMIERRKSFFVEAVCYMLEGITGSSSSGGIDFDLSCALYIQANGTWGAGFETVSEFIDWAQKMSGKTVKKYLEEFLEYGTQLFDEELANTRSQVISPPPTWEKFMFERKEKKRKAKNFHQIKSPSSQSS